jgi:hypothetical protein
MKPIALLVILGSALAIPMSAQVQTRLLVTQPVDEAKLVALPHSVHPLAQPRYDRGVVPDSFPANRMLLLLNPPQERQADLQLFLNGVHSRGSASYHQWITPLQFGERFGPADADVQTAAGWLSSHGFRVSRTSKSRQFIEFSGTAGALREAFHAEIHQYNVNGEIHYANATEVRIPEALAPLIGAISPLNDFRAKPTLRIVGPASYSRSTHQTTPQWTISNGSTPFYDLAPEDFDTQYDLAPLYQAGVNGAGQTIGIVNESNVDLSMVQAFQKLFSLSSATPQVVIDGSDPGTEPGVSVEAYLDLEEAGAVAPGATVNLYIANSSGLFTGDPNSTSVVDPLYLAALRAVDDNQASVLSVSFGNCEGFMLQSGNALWSALWQQAAAQGQTVLVSSGDSGSAGCDNANDQWITQYGLAVNGLASTPWNIAVGGTDFYYSDYATGGASAATLWSQTNDANLGSLKAPLQEQVWDTVFGLNAIGPYVQNSAVSIPAGGGGASRCIYSAQNATGSGLPFVCNNNNAGQGLQGYAKPSWQTGTGVPSDGVRDLPDVSLFAANGNNFSAYPICALPGDCAPGSGSGDVEQITMVGGTSASTPAMAAIMALVDQKYGRQGQADFTLYPLAQQKPAAFHDVTLGSNNMTCVSGTADCQLDLSPDRFYSLQNYSAGVGYDLASGLGSVDANVLVNNWNSISFRPTTTSLQISPNSAQAGAPIDATIDVKSSSGSGTPQGSVSVLAALSAASSPSAAVFTLSNGSASGALTTLPGGTYQVWAQYAGDGAFAGSQSSPQTVTIAPVGSSVNVYGFTVSQLSLNPAAPCLVPPNQDVYETSTSSGPWSPLASGSNLGFWSQLAPVAIVNGAWPSFGSGTGSVIFTVDGAPKSTVALNALGYATWVPPTTFTAGTHTIGANYSGDASYASSTAPPFTFVVPKDTPSLSAWPAANCLNPVGSASSCTFSAGDNLRVEVQMTHTGCQTPSGAVTVNLGSLSQNVTLTPGGLTIESLSFVGMPTLAGEAVFQNLPAGTYPLSASYAGDANTLATTSTAPPVQLGQYGQSFTVVATAPPAPLLPTTTAVSVDPPSMQNTLYLDFYVSATVTGGLGSTIPPTGSVDFFDDGVEVGYGTLAPAGANSSTVTTMVDGQFMDFGSSQLKAVYSGDSVYQSSAILTTYQINLSQTPDFLLAPQLRQITVQPGSSATTGLNLASMGGYSGTVSLACTTSSSQITCSLNPATVAVNGQATTTLTIKAAAQTAGLAQPEQHRPARWPAAAGMLAFGFFLLGGSAHRKLRRTMLLSLCLLASMGTISCGGGSITTTTTTTQVSPAATAYSVVVTATASGIVHNATITVLVP